MIIVEVLGILYIIPQFGDLLLSDPKRGGAEFGSDSERSSNNDIIYSISQTETITWFICFNQCMGLLFFVVVFFSYKNYTFIYLV